MFKDRKEAGYLLAQKLKGYSGEGTIVLGLARGGVVIASQVAKILQASWNVLVVKKIGAPSNPELAIGAVGPDRVVVWDEALCQNLDVSEKEKAKLLEFKSKEREAKENFFHQGRERLNLKEKTIILVDDGIATGATTEAAVEWIRLQKPNKIILAVPVAPPDALEKLKPEVEEIVCLETPWGFGAVGQFYRDFSQVTDEEVVELLERKE